MLLRTREGSEHARGSLARRKTSTWHGVHAFEDVVVRQGFVTFVVDASTLLGTWHVFLVCWACCPRAIVHLCCSLLPLPIAPSAYLIHLDCFLFVLNREQYIFLCLCLCQLSRIRQQACPQQISRAQLPVLTLPRAGDFGLAQKPR